LAGLQGVQHDMFLRVVVRGQQAAKPRWRNNRR